MWSCNQAAFKIKGCKYRIYCMNSLLEDKYLYCLTLQRYKHITGQVDLPTVCNQFSGMNYYRGIVDLTLTAAARRDPQGLAEHYYECGEPAEDTHGMWAFNVRSEYILYNIYYSRWNGNSCNISTCSSSISNCSSNSFTVAVAIIVVVG